jgi:hypothetical protein
VVVPQPPSGRQNEAVSAQVYIHRSVCAQDTDDQADRELQRGRDSNDVALHGHEQTLRRMVPRPWAWFQCCGHAFKAPGHAFQVVGKLPRLWASFRAPGACFRGPGACFPGCGQAFEAPGHAFQTVGMTDGSRQRNEQVGEYRGRKTPSVLVTQHSL